MRLVQTLIDKFGPLEKADTLFFKYNDGEYRIDVIGRDSIFYTKMTPESRRAELSVRSHHLITDLKIRKGIFGKKYIFHIRSGAR